MQSAPPPAVPAVDLLSLPADKFEEAARVTLGALAGYVRAHFRGQPVAILTPRPVPRVRQRHTGLALCCSRCVRRTTRAEHVCAQGVNIASSDPAAPVVDTAQGVAQFEELQRAAAARCGFLLDRLR